MGLVKTESPEVFFKNRIADAMKHQRVDTSAESTAYLVELLASFVRPDQIYTDTEIDIDQPVAEIFLSAVASAGMRKFKLLKLSGDISLFISGIFPDSLNRKMVDVDYYVKLGGTAYATVAVDCHSHASAELFEELAKKFWLFAEVLNEVSERCSLAEGSNLLWLYESYLKSGSERRLSRLRRRGIPLLPGAMGRVH